MPVKFRWLLIRVLNWVPRMKTPLLFSVATLLTCSWRCYVAASGRPRDKRADGSLSLLGLPPAAACVHSHPTLTTAVTWECEGVHVYGVSSPLG